MIISHILVISSLLPYMYVINTVVFYCKITQIDMIFNKTNYYQYHY